MTELEILIDDLQNADLEQRYSACKSLRAQDELPPFAMDALQEAATDPEPLVSATAHMALLRHQSQSADSYTLSEPYQLPRPYTSLEILKCIVLSVVIGLLTIPLINIINDDRLNDLWFISFPAVLLAGYISYLSFEDDGQRRLLAILSSLTVGLANRHHQLLAPIRIILIGSLRLSRVLIHP